MVNKQKIRIALVGNPNAGKSSIFNQLTGLRQKVANFPGVTVDKKVGHFNVVNGKDIELIDFPGTYSLYPTTSDERVVTKILTNCADESFPDAFIYVADATNLEKHLLLLTQIKDMNIPIIFVLNMIDLAQKEDIKYNYEQLSKDLEVPVVAVSGKYGLNIDGLKQEIANLTMLPINTSFKPFYSPSVSEMSVIQKVTEVIPVQSSYQALIIGHHHSWLPFITPQQQSVIHQAIEEAKFNNVRYQIEETMKRFDKFLPLLKKAIVKPNHVTSSLSDKVDSILTHRLLGPIIFFITIFLVFQSIFSLATYPMDWIELGIGWLNDSAKSMLPDSWFTGLLTDGLIAGLGGILVFIPQIAILFFLLSILEESGYMARVVYMFDNLMQRFGLNGRSLVAMVSGGACAIPAIMSTRTIENWKERLITILVTPLISCSARIPVFAVLVSFVVPTDLYWYGFKAQGWVFTGLYLLGIIAALVLAFILKFIIKSDDVSSLIMELPSYRLPTFKNLFFTVREKVLTFVTEAGKVILAISLALWILSTFGPKADMLAAEAKANVVIAQQQLGEDEAKDLLASYKIEASFAGQMGKWIEPAIEPLGFDWKIGIALITSFAAREVFVGTMATIYSIGSAGDDSESIRAKMSKELRPDGTQVYSVATSVSLLVFYVFALQCMSTLAVVKRETKSWQWAFFQFVLMAFLAYVGSYIAYQVLS